MKRQNINNIIVIILAVFLSCSLMGCSDAKKSYILTVNYKNDTSQGVNVIITHSYSTQTLEIPAKESKSYIKRYYVRDDNFFESIKSVVLDFHDGKQVVYSRDVDKDKKTNLCSSRNYTNINDEYLITITADNYNESKTQ